MRTRITWTVIISVVVALTLVGVGTFGLVRAESRRDAQAALEDQAAALAELLAVAFSPTGGQGGQRSYVPRGALDRVSEAPGEWEVGVVAINGQGESFGQLPDRIELSAAQQAALEAGGAVSGRSGDRLFAVEARPSGRGVVIVGLTSDAAPGLAEGAEWFLLASAVVTGLAILAALRVGKALARPIRDATAAAGRIAAGDLGVRLPEPAARKSDERAALARSLNSMADTLERSRVLEQRFLLSISHDLRTPLTNIRGYAEAIADGAAESSQDAAEVIVTESARLDRFMDDLMDLARLDSREFRLHTRDADLVAEAGAAAERFREELARAGLELVVHTRGPGRGRVDPDRLAQVVGNLVSNAARFARTRVTVTARTEDESVVVAVADDGPGITPEDLPHIFERMYRARAQPERAESGHGLGLAIVRELVGAMGGDVRADSSVAGAVLEFRLPLELATE